MAGAADHAKTFDEDQAGAEFDQIVARRKSRAAASAVKRKIRMAEDDIAFIMSMTRCDIPSDEDEDDLELLSRLHPDVYTPEVMEQRRREHKELVEIFRRDDEEIEARQAEMMRELGEKGYVEADELDQTYIDEINEWTRVQREKLASSSKSLSRMRITDEEDAEALKNFLSRQAAEEEEYDDDEEDYYSDEDDDAATVELEPSDSVGLTG